MPVRPMPQWKTGLEELRPGLYAYLQYNGTWGISNAGFLVADEGVLVIDALMLPSMARAFIKEIRQVTDKRFRHLVNTHHHGDHTNGNQFFAGAEIISHVACREEMIKVDRERRIASRPALPWLTEAWQQELQEVRLTLPTVTFDDKMVLYYGETPVELYYWGPAHTSNDLLVYLPESKALFVGDIGFFYCTPIVYHLSNFIRVIDRIKGLDVEIVVPGHGPLGSLRELEDSREYLVFLQEEARRCFERGMSEAEAAKAIDLGPYKQWLDWDRLERNVAAAYREFRGEI